MLAAGLTAGCITTGSLRPDAPLEVVERSKADAPPWSGEAAGKATEAPDAWHVLTVRTKLLNLPLGLKQAQLAAIDAAPPAMAQAAVDRLLADQTALPADAAAELNRLARAAAETATRADAHIADIYFEKLSNTALPASDPMAQFYTAYVLVTLPADALTKTLTELAPKLAASRSAPLKALAGAAQRLSASLKHK